MEHLSKIATTIEFTEENIEPLVEVALTTLSSKIVNKSLPSPVLTLRFKRQMAEIAVRAVLSVANASESPTARLSAASVATEVPAAKLSGGAITSCASPRKTVHRKTNKTIRILYVEKNITSSLCDVLQVANV